jgi:hypothetical protein
MASSQDEFADALRNAYLAPGEEVHVVARIEDTAGKPHVVRRVLTIDYGKRQECQSRLEIDGAVADAGGLASLGVTLSQPPFEAPVLAQHTLSHIFSVGPQDRATYFKALLEVTDLEQFRNEVANLPGETKPPQEPLLVKFDACLSVPELKIFLEDAAFTTPDAATLAASIESAAGALIVGAGEIAPATLTDCLEKIEELLNARRSKTFPVLEFARTELAGWTPVAQNTWTRLATYLQERTKVTEETRQLAALFGEALKLPAVSNIAGPSDCPLCATSDALTPERVAVIRKHVEGTADFKTAHAAARESLTQLSISANSLASAATAALPQWMKTPAAKRKSAGFTVGRMKKLLGDRSDAVTHWLEHIRPLARSGAALKRAAQSARALANKHSAELELTAGFEELHAAFSALEEHRSAFAKAIEAYKGPTQVLADALNSVIDTQEDSAGWKDFVVIARQQVALRTALIERQARAVLTKEIEAALGQIDRAKENVLNDKFADYSADIQTWWERLRPDEATFFAAIQPRKGARRTIDFKAGLSSEPGRTSPKLRDVIAVFSQSQLHCLGLALFLARAARESMGFIVLDDPVLSSDEDYRVHFNATVLSELLKLPMQVLVLTQDHTTWKELESRYRHVGIANAQIFIEDSGHGSIIENTGDALIAKIHRARSLARGGHPDTRKECGVQLRDAGERFCKEMLVNDRHRKGDAVASLSDYDEKVLEWLCPRVEPLLVHDPSHPGKLEVFRNTVNNACHDNAPPASATMVHACGEIEHLVKTYLGR